MIRSSLITAVLFVAACATSYDLRAHDRTVISAQNTSFEHVFVASSTTEIINVTSLPMIAAIAAEGSVSEKEVRRQSELMSETNPDFKGVTFPKSTLKVIG